MSAPDLPRVTQIMLADGALMALREDPARGVAVADWLLGLAPGAKP